MDCSTEDMFNAALLCLCSWVKRMRTVSRMYEMYRVAVDMCIGPTVIGPSVGQHLAALDSSPVQPCKL